MSALLAARVALLVGVSFGSGEACATAQPAGPSPAAQRDDHAIVASQAGSTVTIAMGQTVSVARPADFPDWQVDFASEILELLTPAAERRSPGSAGWRFKAIAAGETDLRFTAITSGGAAPPTFTFTLQVRP